MKRIRSVIVAVFILIFSVCFSACNGTGSAIDLYYFKTVIHIETHGKTLSSDCENKLTALFSSLEAQFAADGENSFVNRFNNAESGEIITLSDQAAEVFKEAERCNEFTGGLFSPAVYPLVKLWQFAPSYPVSNFTLPNGGDVSAAAALSDFSTITFDEKAKTVTKPNSETEMDFGGILKGYAADRAAEILKSAGYESGYISVGGSSLYILSADTLSVRHPRATENMPAILSVNLKNRNNLSVSTSGDYEKFYEKDGKRYSHIINPTTGYPADTNIQSVTVIGADGAFSDAVTTAACLKAFDPDNYENSELTLFFKEILEEYPSASLFAVYDDGSKKIVLTNEKECENFTLSDSAFSVKSI